MGVASEGRHTRPRRAAAATGSGLSASHAGTPTRAGWSSPGRARSTASSVGCRGDRLELRRRMGDRRRDGARRARRHARRPARHAGPRPNGAPTGWPAFSSSGCAPGQSGALPLQLPRVPGVDLRHLKVGLVPVNTNYRYTDDELVYLWDNADAVAVIFHGTFTERIEGLRPAGAPGAGWMWVDDGPVRARRGPRPTRGRHGARPTAPCAPRGGAAATTSTCSTPGGTTGMPKGVMWRQDDLFADSTPATFLRVPEDGGVDGVRKTVVGAGPRHLPACPLMHGTGGFTAMARHGRGRVRGDARRTTLRRRRAPRHHRPRQRQHHRHRGRRLRQAHPARPRRRARTAGGCQRCSPSSRRA